MQFLWGLTGQMKAVKDFLTTYWTSARAAKIDNLDAAISTTAPAATALSTATWTGTKAGYLDGAISGRLGSIKAIYTGTIVITSLTNTATITAVNTSRSICLFNGCTSGAIDINTALARVALTNSTTVTATRDNTGSATTVGYTVIEFNA